MLDPRHCVPSWVLSLFCEPLIPESLALVLLSWLAQGPLTYPLNSPTSSAPGTDWCPRAKPIYPFTLIHRGPYLLPGRSRKPFSLALSLQFRG